MKEKLGMVISTSIVWIVTGIVAYFMIQAEYDSEVIVALFAIAMISTAISKVNFAEIFR
ncbi:hypothetical protein ACFLY7_01450 [Patescibacteria group bacterium]